MSSEIPPSRPESTAATRVQILATEHWSLLATRALTYNESLTRVNIFLAILSGAVITLALVAQVDRFGATFTTIAIPMLVIVLYTGLATIARLMHLNRDDHRWVIGMNRLRHAYLEIHPELEPDFVTSPYDDLPGALQTLGIDDVTAGAGVGSVFHLPQTLPGMLGVIVAAVAAAIGALGALALGLPAPGVGLAAIGGFVLLEVLIWVWSRMAYTRVSPILQPRFPSPRS